MLLKVIGIRANGFLSVKDFIAGLSLKIKGKIKSGILQFSALKPKINVRDGRSDISPVTSADNIITVDIHKPQITRFSL